MKNQSPNESGNENVLIQLIPTVDSFKHNPYFFEINEMLDDARSIQPCFSEVKKLGVVFDIDGTLIGLNKRDEYQGIKIRDDAIAFIQWLKSRGHHVSIWTKASKFWAHSVVKKICTLINGVHGCTGYKCKKTFDFIWCDDMLRKVKTPNPLWVTGRDEECKWCEAYSSTCTECECIWNDDECPCRKVKDLRKIWYSSEEATKGFVEERTLIIEDTPQNCRYNYGNAIYVPRYRGYPEEDGKKSIFSRLQSYFEKEIETCENVRHVRKCHHEQKYHACYEQSWLKGDRKICRPCE